MNADGHHQQTLGYLYDQFGQFDRACASYQKALTLFQAEQDQAAASQIANRLTELNCPIETDEQPTYERLNGLKAEILRLCRLGIRHSRNGQHQIALKVLDRSLQMSDRLTDLEPHQGNYYAAIILGMMGKIYTGQRYYLFAMAAFKASLEAYQQLAHNTRRIKTRMASVLCAIANIAEITNHPDVAIEYYLDALWYWNTADQEPQARQVVQQLERLCEPRQLANLLAG